MTGKTQNKTQQRRGEEGVVLLMVLLLIVMFSGLGLLAMRHVQGELRSASAYMDSTQAAAAAEAAIMMTATDMRRNWRYPNSENRCLNYYAQFQQALMAGLTENIATGFSDVFNFAADDCDHIGHLPVAGLNKSEPLAMTGGPLSHSYADVLLSQSPPRRAPPPPGYSSDDEARTYDWYYFTVTSRATYGYGDGPSVSDGDTDMDTDVDTAGDEEVPAIRGSAVVRSHMKIGPVDAIGAN